MKQVPRPVPGNLNLQTPVLPPPQLKEREGRGKTGEERKRQSEASESHYRSGPTPQTGPPPNVLPRQIPKAPSANGPSESLGYESSSESTQAQRHCRLINPTTRNKLSCKGVHLFLSGWRQWHSMCRKPSGLGSNELSFILGLLQSYNPPFLGDRVSV